MQFEAVFVDRDGTMGGIGHFMHPRDFQLYPGTLEALRRLQSSGLKVFAFTNQHRISRGAGHAVDLPSAVEWLPGAI